MTTNRSNAVARLEEIRARWLAAIDTKDARPIDGTFADDAQFLIPNRPLVAGRPAVERAWKDLLAAPGIAFTFGPIAVAEAGDVAYETGTYGISLDTPQGRWKDRGKYAIVWKHVNGAWKVAVDALNSDLQTVFPNV